MRYGPPVTNGIDHFDEPIAERYDQAHVDTFRPDVVDPAVDLLAELADGGRALELGIGTGRIALPLAARGVPVHGIELSTAMVERLRGKPGGSAIGVTIGDFASARVDGVFSLAFLLYNTIMNLTTQEAQVDCFRNVADHLEPGGCFVVEVLVPELRKIPQGQKHVMFKTGPVSWAWSEYDVVTQSADCHYVRTGENASYRTIPFRYVWPSELDLMARLAGLRLRHRWDDWSRQSFTEDSAKHISVWEKPSD
jgi:SAM-dependent methyltransferase